MRLVYVDIEATGFSHSDEITQLAFIVFEKGKLIHYVSEYFQPTRQIPSNVVKVTNVDNIMIKTLSGGKKIENCLQDILDKVFVGDCIFISHNVTFDMGILNDKCERFGITYNYKKTFCTMKYYSSYLGYSRYKKLSFILNEAINRLELEPSVINELFEESFPKYKCMFHDALYDAFCCYLIDYFMSLDCEESPYGRYIY